MSPLIEVRGLRYRYEDGTDALRGIDFTVYPGETVVLLGANGSGKTTFLLHLNGLLQGEGSVRVCGMDVSPRNFREVRSKVGMVFQDADEQLFMPTVLDDVAFGPLKQGFPAEEAAARARSALARVGLGDIEHRAPYHLSAGEKRRAALAGVLAMEPEILVLDEPTTYLDPPAQRNLIGLLVSLPQAKVVATHDVRFAAALATRAVFFDKGRVAKEGKLDEIVELFQWDWGT